jgi:hypothetical protein
MTKGFSIRCLDVCLNKHENFKANRSCIALESTKAIDIVVGSTEPASYMSSDIT